jgi:hypothetical protein
VHQIDGRYQCALCGAVVDLPQDAKPRIVLKSAGGEPTIRAIWYRGQELHACPIGDRKPSLRT